MTVAWIHHYVARCYLKGFTRGNQGKSQLVAVDIMHAVPIWISPRNVFAARDFNRVDIPGESIDVLEKALARFDGELGSALQTIQREMNRSAISGELRV